MQGATLLQLRDYRKHMPPPLQRFWDRVRAKQLAGMKWRKARLLKGVGWVDFHCPGHNLAVVFGDRQNIKTHGPVRILRFPNDVDTDSALRAVLANARTAGTYGGIYKYINI